MTDHRPEVRRYKFPDRVIADYLAMRMRTEGETEYVLASDYDAAIAKLQAAPPIEPVGVREALEAINTEWNKGKHGQGMDSFHAWYSAHIELIEAALITSEKPVVEEVVTVLTVRDHNWGCGFDAEDMPGKIKLCAYSTTKVNEGDRIRVVVYREEAE